MSRWLQPEFQDTFPLPFLMRQRYPQLWLRIHTLPDSKRYPDDEKERAIIFERYSSFATALLGNNTSCLFVRSRFAEEEIGTEFEHALSWFPLHKIEEEDNYWYSWAAEAHWTPDALRNLLMNVAEDRDAHVLFVSKDSDSIFAPYDGGADGFSFDLGLIARLKHEFQPWLSTRADGL